MLELRQRFRITSPTNGTVYSADLFDHENDEITIWMEVWVPMMTSKSLTRR